MEGTRLQGGEAAVYAAKALDALRRKHAAGIAGECRPKAVKQAPGLPHGEWPPAGPPEA